MITENGHIITMLDDGFQITSEIQGISGENNALVFTESDIKYLRIILGE